MVLIAALLLPILPVSSQNLGRSVTWEKIKANPAPLPVIGEIVPVQSDKNKESHWSVGSETLDRDFADFSKYKKYIKETGAGYANITAIPDAISSADAESLFIKMTDDITEGKGNPALTEQIRREKALYQIACKAAIKGGRRYDSSIINWLVSRVLALPDIIVCPHGRPIAYRLTKNELDRQFERLK